MTTNTNHCNSEDFGKSLKLICASRSRCVAEGFGQLVLDPLLGGIPVSILGRLEGFEDSSVNSKNLPALLSDLRSMSGIVLKDRSLAAVLGHFHQVLMI